MKRVGAGIGQIKPMLCIEHMGGGTVRNGVNLLRRLDG